ncbi:hypothetical protein DPMN_177736 [Dreissena polymorpha]|uniref:Uncharacterized protein n=1 Tax=Dreissena polymorpha TaxID=45954 RepID=A0A9D4IKG9_DREPO|nr:hypothetical protein DPMN_177736 [Dreissena polymorpha]
MPALGSHVFQTNVTIFKLIQDIIETNLLTKFHDDQTINVASKVLTSGQSREMIKYYYVVTPPSHVFKATKTIFELIQDVIVTNFLTKFHENQTINVASRENAPTPKCHVFQPTGTIFKLVKDIIGMNLLTMFHEDQTMNVASRDKTPPLGSHVFQANRFTVTIFELIQEIIETNLLTKLHEDWK